MYIYVLIVCKKYAVFILFQTTRMDGGNYPGAFMSRKNREKHIILLNLEIIRH